MPLYAGLFICALCSPAGKGLTTWLSFVVSNCELVTFQLVAWDGCGASLYRLLIFAPLLTFIGIMVWTSQPEFADGLMMTLLMLYT